MVFLCESVARASVDFPSELWPLFYPIPIHLAFWVCASQDRSRFLTSDFCFCREGLSCWHLFLITVNLLPFSALGWAKITWPNSKPSFSFYSRNDHYKTKMNSNRDFLPILSICHGSTWASTSKFKNWEQLYFHPEMKKWINTRKKTMSIQNIEMECATKYNILL